MARNLGGVSSAQWRINPSALKAASNVWRKQLISGAGVTSTSSSNISYCKWRSNGAAGAGVAAVPRGGCCGCSSAKWPLAA